MTDEVKPATDEEMADFFVGREIAIFRREQDGLMHCVECDASPVGGRNSGHRGICSFSTWPKIAARIVADRAALNAAESNHRAMLETVGEEATRQVADLTAEVNRLKNPCRCGSGGHPRRCERHPEAFQQHVDRINHEFPQEQIDELNKEMDGLMAALERERAVRRELQGTLSRIEDFTSGYGDIAGVVNRQCAESRRRAAALDEEKEEDNGKL